MMSFLRRLIWWLRPQRKEEDLRDELRFHVEQEAMERRASGLSDEEARSAAHRDLGNEARVREDVRAVWTWQPLDEVTQDLRYAFRTLFRYRAVSVFAMFSLALGIGANTAIYSFMDAILLRSLPVPDPDSLVVMTWQSKPFDFGRSGRNFVMHSISGSIYPREDGREARIFPFLAFERMQQVSSPVLSSIFAFSRPGRMNVLINGEAQLADVQFVTGAYFSGVGVPPAAGRLFDEGDDRAGAPPIVVISNGYARRRFGSIDDAVGKPLSINNLPFTVVGVTAPDFFGVDPGTAPSVYLPFQLESLFDAGLAKRNVDPNYYFAGIVGRLRPGVTLDQAQSMLEAPFEQWVATTASNDVERANLPVLRLTEGAGGLDTLRRRYSKPLYVLLAMVGVTLAIACANTANLLLARARSRRREIAVRLGVGAGHFRLIRQLLTESMVLAGIAGILGVVIAVAGARLLTVLLASGGDQFAVRAELNWNVLAVTIGLSMLCGVLFGLVPAIQSTRLALVPALKDSNVDTSRPRRGWFPRVTLTRTLVVSQVSLLMLLLVAAGLFVRTLSNLHSIPLGFNPDNLLLFELNAPQAGHPETNTANFYTDLQRRFSEIPGVLSATLSHASLLKAGEGHPTSIDGVPAERTRFLQTGSGFFSTMGIPMLQGRAIDDRDRAGAQQVAVINDLFARSFFPNQNPIGRHIKVGGSLPMHLEIIGVAAMARYGPLKYAVPPVIYVSYPQIPTERLKQMTFALRTAGDPMRHVATVRQIVRTADARVPLTNMITQRAEIDQTINQEIVMARLATAFAVLALVIACVGLYGTMAYAVARRTREIGIRLALGARRTAVIRMVVSEISVLTALGLVISIPLARGTSQFVTSFLFEMQPNDPRAIGTALAALLTAALLASYAPARRATRIDPTTALREE
jgi:predicted permease